MWPRVRLGSLWPRDLQRRNYPTRPLRIIVPFAPGGLTDNLARLMDQWRAERLGQSFIIESRPGTGTNIATEVVVHAPPDGNSFSARLSAGCRPDVGYPKRWR
jgi:tripartite-type tricarboxylate transporter receptor subunit TctC